MEHTRWMVTWECGQAYAAEPCERCGLARAEPR